jgi:phospholipid/cholesterol/gamma-HCH transport system substrate-binding protein
MAEDSSKNIRVGLFVIIGGILFIMAMYLIGAKQNLFGNIFKISANFHNVNGLMVGNNVRFGGINVGTIRDIELVNDSTITVVMMIEKNTQKFIKKNTLASVGTDGLMGNKLVNLSAVNENSPMIEEGDVINSLRPIETDEMIRTLNRTNEDVAVIVKNLKLITQKVNSPNTLWSILMDTVIAENVKNAIVNIKVTTNRTAVITGDLSEIVKNVKAGNGTVGALLTDTTIMKKINQTIVNIKLVSDTLAYISGDFSSVSKKIKNGEGAIGTILMDTSFVHNLNRSMLNIKNGSQGLDDNMEALKHSIFLKKYFKKKEKEAKKNKTIN